MSDTVDDFIRRIQAQVVEAKAEALAETQAAVDRSAVQGLIVGWRIGLQAARRMIEAYPDADHDALLRGVDAILAIEPEFRKRVAERVSNRPPQPVAFNLTERL